MFSSSLTVLVQRGATGKIQCTRCTCCARSIFVWMAGGLRTPPQRGRLRPRLNNEPLKTSGPTSLKFLRSVALALCLISAPAGLHRAPTALRSTEPLTKRVGKDGPQPQC